MYSYKEIQKVNLMINDTYIIRTKYLSRMPSNIFEVFLTVYEYVCMYECRIKLSVQVFTEEEKALNTCKLNVMAWVIQSKVWFSRVVQVLYCYVHQYLI